MSDSPKTGAGVGEEDVLELQEELSQISLDTFADPVYNGRRRARELMLETLLHGIQKQEKKRPSAGPKAPSFPKCKGKQKDASAVTWWSRSQKAPLKTGRMKR